MKWVPVVEKVTERGMKILRGRGLLGLLSILTLLLLSSANFKWTG